MGPSLVQTVVDHPVGGNAKVKLEAPFLGLFMGSNLVVAIKLNGEAALDLLLTL